MYVDNIEYCEITPGDGFSKTKVNNKNVPGSSVWESGTKLAPFDKEFYLTIGVGVGGNNYFPDGNSKPWINGSPKGMRNFWKSRQSWYSSWRNNKRSLEVDYVRIYAV